jgi:LysM repeat protein
MRTQTIAGVFDGQDWVAEPVDPTGWLAVPGQSPVARETTSAPVGQHDATKAPDVRDRRAGGGHGRRAGVGSGRRTGRVRHLRRVRTEGLRTEVIGAAPLAAAPQLDPVAVEGYRMGRWARLTLSVTVLAAVVVVIVSLTAGSGQQALVDVTVTPGDTLWSIATEAAPDRDPRDVIEEIRQLNQVPGDVLPIGVVLRVPAADG